MKIKIDPSKKLTLYSQEFDEMRNNLDLTLQTTLKAMIAKNMDAAAIGLKINVELIKVDLADDNAPTGTRPAMKPEISARIVAAMQQRVDKKCNVIGRASKKEILIDDDGNMCLVSEEEASGQLSMFNSWDEFKEAATEGQAVPISEDDEDDEMPFAEDPDDDEEEDDDDADM